MLIIAKISPSRMPTNTDGSAAGSRILQNCCARRQPEAAADVDQHRAACRRGPRRSSGSPARARRRSRSSRSSSRCGRRSPGTADTPARSAPRRARRPTSRTPGAAAGSGRAARRAPMPTTASSRLAHSTSCVVCQKRCSTFSSAMMRGIAARICDGSGTMNAVDHAARGSAPRSTPIAASSARDAEQRARRCATRRRRASVTASLPASQRARFVVARCRGSPPRAGRARSRRRSGRTRRCRRPRNRADAAARSSTTRLSLPGR